MKRKRVQASRRRLERIAWKITPRAYRTTLEGKPAVLVLDVGGTTLKPLSAFSEAELIRYLGKNYVP